MPGELESEFYEGIFLLDHCGGSNFRFQLQYCEEIDLPLDEGLEFHLQYESAVSTYLLLTAFTPTPKAQSSR